MRTMIADTDPLADDPVGSTTQLCEQVLPRLAELP